ncbi:MAG: Flagellar biosynthetic protein FlhB [Candidatus Brocadiaceae bacterium]|nr:Flagellar biosynthetic protein FlhB [Candidatus Brocadiaceae bacterium]
MAGDEEKTEEPSGRRLGEAREKGNIAFSADLNNAVGLLGGIVLLYNMGVLTYQVMDKTFKVTLGHLFYKDFSQDVIMDIIFSQFYVLTKMLFPILGGLMLIGLIISYVQTGFLLNFGLLKLNFGKLNFIAGAKNLVSPQSFVKLLFSVLKVVVLAGMSYLYMKDKFNSIIDALDFDVAQIFITLFSMMYGLALRLAMILFILAAADFIYQKWQYKRGLRMTKQEVKEERKQMEGDPLIKGKIRSIQLQMSRKRMMTAVPTADVVITNPTHFAVALKYDSKVMKSPTVVAKGADLIAKRIKELALKHKVPLVEDKPLAQTLYKSVEIGREVPQKLFYAVAKVLAYVYQLKRERR